jgi:TubC N-terminal docking domain
VIEHGPDAHPAELADRLEAVGVRLRAADGELRFRTSRGVLSDEDRAELRRQRSAVIEYVQEDINSVYTGGWRRPYESAQWGGPMTLHVFPGGHFHLIAQRDAVLPPKYEPVALAALDDPAAAGRGADTTEEI